MLGCSSVDILPLVEFEVDNQLTHEQIQLILSKNEIKDKEKADRRGSQSTRTEKIDLNSQTLEVYSHDSLVTENDKEGFNIFTATENVNEATNLIILGEAELAKLDPAHLVTFPKRTQGDPSKRQYQYFLNMMPEISIIACSHCNKVLIVDIVCTTSALDNLLSISSSTVTNLNFKFSRMESVHSAAIKPSFKDINILFECISKVAKVKLNWTW